MLGLPSSLTTRRALYWHVTGSLSAGAITVLSLPRSSRLRPREVEWFAQGHSAVVLGFSQPLSGWLESPGMVFSMCSSAPWVRCRQNSSLRALCSRSRAFYVCVRLPAQGVFLLFCYQIQFQNVYCSRKLGIIIANITEHLPGVRRCPKRLKMPGFISSLRRGGCYYLHRTERKTEAWRSYVTCPSSCGIRLNQMKPPFYGSKPIKYTLTSF